MVPEGFVHSTSLITARPQVEQVRLEALVKKLQIHVMRCFTMEQKQRNRSLTSITRDVLMIIQRICEDHQELIDEELLAVLCLLLAWLSVPDACQSLRTEMQKAHSRPKQTALVKDLAQIKQMLTKTTLGSHPHIASAAEFQLKHMGHLLSRKVGQLVCLCANENERASPSSVLGR